MARRRWCWRPRAGKGTGTFSLMRSTWDSSSGWWEACCPRGGIHLAARVQGSPPPLTAFRVGLLTGSLNSDPPLTSCTVGSLWLRAVVVRWSERTEQCLPRVSIMHTFLVLWLLFPGVPKEANTRQQIFWMNESLRLENRINMQVYTSQACELQECGTEHSPNNKNIGIIYGISPISQGLCIYYFSSLPLSHTHTPLKDSKL